MMTDDIQVRDGGATFLAAFDERGTRIKLLETEVTAVHEQLDAVLEQNTQMRARIEQLTGRLDASLAQANGLKQFVDEIGRKYLAGLGRLGLMPQTLRGVPVRNDTPREVA